MVTGAQLYDEWFERQPTRDYETFCHDFGFDAKKPTILYCGSSIFIARDEVEFVREWLRQVRNAADPVLGARTSWYDRTRCIRCRSIISTCRTRRTWQCIRARAGCR